MKRILLVCTANQNRSRTAEDLLRSDPRYEVRSAGTDVYELDPEEHPVAEEDVAWADVIFVMEQYHLDVLDERFPGCSAKVRVLEIPDDYFRGDPRLISILRKRLARHLDRE
jgi:predicted protein tyrosine phosphatase